MGGHKFQRDGSPEVCPDYSGVPAEDGTNVGRVPKSQLLDLLGGGEGKRKAAYKPSGSNSNQESNQEEDPKVAVAAQIPEMGNQANPEGATGMSKELGSTRDSVARRTKSAQQGVNPEGEATFLEDKTGPSHVEESTPDAADPGKLKADE